MNQPITPKVLKNLASHIDPNDALRNLAERAVTTNGIYVASENNALSAVNTTIFSDEIETGSVTDQKESGRCWLFATLNIIRHQIATDYKIEDFELSQSYSFFWDKLERANTFYEKIIATAGEPLEDRNMVYVLEHPQVDGGWWEYSSSVIAKYGVVPKSVMPESVATSKSAQLNIILNRKLRKDAITLRGLAVADTPSQKLQATKEVMLSEVYRILTIAIGTPPQSFNFAYRDKDKKYHREEGITPKQFLKKYSKLNFSDYVTILNDPTSAKSYNQTYVFAAGGNVIGGQQPLLLNVDIETLKKLTYKQIKSGKPVWFGCDVGTDTNKKGFMSTDTYDFKSTFSVDFSFDKAQRLAMRDASISHAMVITGVDVVDGVPAQWKVENSWGAETGNKGYYTMSDDWFTANGYVVVIHRSLLSKKLKDALEKQPIVIPDWDPINTSL